MNVPRILLLGKNGQVGWELQRSLASLGPLIALDRHSDTYCGDLDDPDRLAATVATIRPHVIVNAAAYTAVDKAEAEPAQARRINTVAVDILARSAQACGAWLIHYSTDYVFDGSGDRPWTEQGPTGPQNVYGQTKLDGEIRVRQACERHLIFRTSWVYSARGGNFAKTMLRLAHERERLTVIDDQWGAPTGAELIADVTAHALRQVLRTQAGAGTYHLAAAGATTWHGYASHVVSYAQNLQRAAQWKVQGIDAVPTSAFPTPAKRPHNSRLDTTALQLAFDLHLPNWQNGVERMLDEVLIR